MEISYDVIRRKFPNAFCVDNLRIVYKANRDELSMSFVDFLMYAEDYYVLKYSNVLSKTAWWLFSLLRHLVRYDGFVKLSYSDVMNYFGGGESSISKPTFFKYIGELEQFGLVKRFNNKKLFDTKYQNDSNTYVVIGCIDEIVEICKQITDMKSFRANVLSDNDVGEITQQTKRKLSDGKTDVEEYNELIDYYEPVISSIEDLFEFLGRQNKSGKIALSRKLKILNFLYEMEVYNEDIDYAVAQTIKKNIKSEKYFFGILRNMYKNDEQSSDDENDDLRQKYANNDNTSSGMSYEEYLSERRLLLNSMDRLEHYKSVIFRLKDKRRNSYEQKLYNAAIIISNKIDGYSDAYGERSANRRMMLRKKYGIYEFTSIDKHFNRIILWRYGEDDDCEIVPLSVMKKIKADNKSLFDVYKYEIPNGRYYNGL